MNSALFVTVRMESRRRPSLALRKLLGRPLLGHLMERLRQVPAASRIVVCTSWLPEDDLLEAFAVSQGVDCFRGHPEDVRARLLGAATHFRIDQVITCGGDTPLVDPEVLCALHRYHCQSDHDYSRTEGLPQGAFGYVVSRRALERALRIPAAAAAGEKWNGCFMQSANFRWGTLLFNEPSLRWPDLRVSVEREEDFCFMEDLFVALYREGSTFGIAEVIAHCRRSGGVPLRDPQLVHQSHPAH